MLKRASFFLVPILILSVIVSFSASAAESKISVFIDGRDIVFEAPPSIVNGTTLVPMRKIFEEQGASINYEAKTKTVTAVKGDIMIKYKIGAKTAAKNGKSLSLAVPGRIMQQRLRHGRGFRRSHRCTIARPARGSVWT